MPPAKKTYRKKAAKKVYKKRASRLPSNVPEWASLSESFTGADCVTNTMYGPSTVGLDQFPRAVSVASNYQEYRITHIKVTFKPRFDTFMVDPNVTTALVVPNLYYMIDKPQAIPTTATLETLKQMGAKPKRFDDKNVTVSWSPGVLLNANSGALVGTLSKPLISPWLNTNATPDAAWTPNSVDHSGLFNYLEAGGITGDGRYEYGVDVEVQFQFRKPLAIVGAGNTQALQITRKVDHSV